MIAEDVPQRGVPPYTVFSCELNNIRAHPSHFSLFAEALMSLFDLTNGGSDTYESNVKTRERIQDSTGAIVFSMSVQEDIAIIQALDEQNHPQKR